VWDDLFRRVVEIAHLVQARAPGDESMKTLQSLIRPIEYMAKRGIHPRHVRNAMMELREIVDSCLIKQPPSESLLADDSGSEAPLVAI